MSQIQIRSGEHTEELLKFILNEIDDETLDSIEVEREILRDSPVASEAMTVGALITLAPVLTMTIARLIERWLEGKRQKDQLELIINGV